MIEQPNPVIFYHPDGYRVNRKDLKGRHSAGESFLSAFLAHAAGPDVYALCADLPSFDAFKASVEESGRPLNARNVLRGDVAALRRQGLLYLPQPGIAQEARVRAFLGGTAYALSGVTHTISSRQVLEGIAELLTAPVQPWDAVICTSRAVQDALGELLGQVENDLRARLGATRLQRPLMPIIPLGVHADRYAQNGADRAHWRKALGIAEDAVVILFFGRLSVHAKASPFQLAQAAELAAARSKRPLALLWCGWFNDDFQQRVFMNTAKSMAPSIPFYHADGRDEKARFSVWSAADIFCSLSDNIQESFGLTVIEAMAAGLPVVVSNWNGYREAVEHGVNGLLIDSYMPAHPLSGAAYRYAGGSDTYDQYIGALSQLTFVDVQQVADALAQLAGDQAMRARLADAAKRTIAERFDWKAVMPRYMELWREQSERLRRARAEAAAAPSTWPALDPARIFSGFPSHRLAGASRLAAGALYGRWNDLIKQPGVVVNPAVLTGRETFRALRELFADGETRTVDEIAGRFDKGDAADVIRTLHWLIKIGLVRQISDR